VLIQDVRREDHPYDRRAREPRPPPVGVYLEVDGFRPAAVERLNVAPVLPGARPVAE
jgi:hypothetical protein